MRVPERNTKRVTKRILHRWIRLSIHYFRSNMTTRRAYRIMKDAARPRLGEVTAVGRNRYMRRCVAKLRISGLGHPVGVLQVLKEVMNGELGVPRPVDKGELLFGALALRYSCLSYLPSFGSPALVPSLNAPAARCAASL